MAEQGNFYGRGLKGLEGQGIQWSGEGGPGCGSAAPPPTFDVQNLIVILGDAFCFPMSNETVV